MEKLSQFEEDRRHVLADELDNLEAAIAKIPAVIERNPPELVAAIIAYNSKLIEARQFIADVCNAMRTYRRSRSDRWRESGQGERYAAWLNEWDRISFQAVSLNYSGDMREINQSEILERLSNHPKQTKNTK